MTRKLRLACLLLCTLVLSGAAAMAAQHGIAPHLSAPSLPPPALTLPFPAMAAPAPVVVSVAPADTSVAVPISDWLAAAREGVTTVLIALLGLALRKLPAPLVWAVKLYGEQKIVDQIVSMGINAVPGAAKGEPLSIDVGSKVLAHGLQWAVETLPGLVIKMLGGQDGLQAKIFAALNLESDASAAALGVKSTA